MFQTKVAVELRSTPLFLMEPCLNFSMKLLPILRRIQRPKTQGHSSHLKKSFKKVELILT